MFIIKLLKLKIKILGDALGSYNEFQRRISDKDLDFAMTLPGKGTHNLNPAQLTDDSELALSLAYGEFNWFSFFYNLIFKVLLKLEDIQI